MDYTKKPLSFEEQANLLIKRGLIVKDRNQLIERLSNVNYVRLSTYWHTFQDNNSDIFLPDTKLEVIWQRYVFDHKLRLIVMDAMGLIEVSILRTRMVEQFTLKYGPFGYADKNNYGSHFKDDKFAAMMEEINRIVSERKNRDESVQEYFHRYKNECYLPLWMLVECLSFGTLLTMFKHMHDAEKKILAKPFNMAEDVLQSWLLSLNYVRNLCAHHDRLWNRELSLQPALPRKSPEWIWLSGNRRVFVILTILNYLVRKINPPANWKGRLKNLLSQYPEIPINKMMGFPEGWINHSLWK